MAFELTSTEETMLLQNSIERVINSGIQLAGYCETRSQSEHFKELGSTNRQDLEELKSLMCKLWDRERDAIVRKRLGK